MSHKKPAIILSVFILFISSVMALNLKVHTRQGVDYIVTPIKIPLYLKILDFFDRHYNYKALVVRITEGAKSDEERVLALFKWCHEHIRPQPQELPIVDDHVWHIIVRGYGAGEQSSDVFTTLCNYAGFDATYYWVDGTNPTGKIAFSFVKIGTRWLVFDQYHGIYFRNNENGLADIGEIAKGDWLMESIDSSGKPDIDYAHYLKNIQRIKRAGLTRSNTQSPLNRLKYEIKRCLSKIL